MSNERKFSPEVEAEIADEYVKGLSQDKLCKKYDTCRPVVARILKEYGAKRPEHVIEKRNINEFESRAKSALWRQDPGKAENRKSYNTWMEKVKFLESQEGAAYTHAQAVVQASKDHPCIARLFREYDLSAFDPNPESHPQIYQPPGAPDEVICEGKKQSYKDSLRWAIEAAGTFMRTGIQPSSCPCDAAYYLYKQAIGEPKDFLTKVGQVESKGSNESEDEANARKSSKRTIAELDGMISELEPALQGSE